MIIFFDKLTGEIIGSVGGRKHYKGEDKFWVGDRATTHRVLYDETAPHFEDAIKDPLMARNFRINRFTLELEPKGVAR